MARSCGSASSSGSSSPATIAVARSSSAASIASGGLFEDLASDLLVAPLSRVALAAILWSPRPRPLRVRTRPAPHSAQRTEHLSEQLTDREFVPRPEARDRRVIGRLVGRDHAERDVLDKTGARSPREAAPRPRTRRPTTPPSSPDQAPRERARRPDRPHRTRVRSSSSTASNTSHARCPAGSHSRKLGGNNNACSRSTRNEPLPHPSSLLTCPDRFTRQPHIPHKTSSVPAV